MQVRIRTFWNTARTLARPVGLAAALLLAAALGPAAMAATGAKNFDHLTTGFPLTGQHESARCEDCHVRGIFKGTPAQCAACHTQGALVTAVMIPNNHFPTSEPCSTCHTTATFYGAHFAHSAVAPGTCSQCHNGVFAKGKTTNHLATTSSCDVCHTTASFTAAYVALPAGHIPTAQACAVCHDPANFVPARGYPTGMVHTGITTGCETCHAAAAAPQLFKLIGTYINPQGQSVKITANGLDVDVYPKPEGPGHIPTQRSCELCHAGGYQPLPPQNFTTFVMNHDGITSGCAACHSDGMSFTGLTTLTQGPRTSTSLITMSSLGKHIPLPAGDDCSTCHTSVTAFGPGTVMNHAGITSNCNQCHEASGTSYYNLSNLAVRPSAAVDPLHPSVGDGDCSTCHRAAFNKGAFNIPSALPAVGHGPSVAHMPNPGGQSCVTCHTTVNEGLAASAVYTAYGQYQMGPAGHSGISSNCQACHERDVGIFLNISQATGSRPLAMVVRPNASAIGITTADSNHPAKTQTNPSGADCITCHTASAFAIGGFANVTIKPNNHIAVTGVSCNTCHTTGSYAAVVLPMPHQGAVAGSCTSCHNGQTFAGSVFTPNALGTAGGTFDGSTGVNFVATQITSKISAGISTSGGHVSIPTADDCSTCHLVTTAFGPNTAMVHTNISTGCANCHEGGYSYAGITNLVARPTTAVDAVHPLSSDGKDCASCHSVVFTTGAFNIPLASALPVAGDGPSISHMPNPAGTACVSCHTGVSTSVSAATAATAYTNYVMGATGHTGITATCQTCHENPSAFLNITSTATLMVRPPQTGAKVGVTPVDILHPLKTQTTPTNGADCSNCHKGGFAAGGFNNVTSLPSGHITLAASVACSTCHTGSDYTSVTLPMPHTGAVSGTCTSCHNGQKFAGSAFTPNGLGTPYGTFDGTTGTNFVATQITSKISAGISTSGGHVSIPTADDCSTCHLVTTAFGPNTAMVHTNISTGCKSCHEGGDAFAGITNLVARPTTAVDSVHPQSSDTKDCSSCHSLVFTSGAFNIPTVLPAAGDGPSISHMPNPAGTACVTCHTGVSAGVSAATAATAYTVYVMGPSGHTGITSSCQTCHENPSAFLNITSTATLMVRPPQTGGTVGITPADANHPLKTQTTPTNGTDCATCHTGTGFVAGGFSTGVTKPANHINISTGAACNSCHTVNTTSVVLPMPHTAVVGTCASCHNAPNTLYAGSVFTPTPGSTSTPASGGTFDGSVGTNFKARQIVQSPAVGASGGHIPLPSGDDCNVCHLSTSAFTGTAMVHTGISSGCASCHAAGSKWYGETYTASPLVTKGNVTLSPLHVPFAGAACEKCHSASVFTSFGTATTVPHTSGVFMTYSGTGNSGNPNRSLTSTPKCITCHAPSGTKWYLGTGQSMSSATMGSHHNSQSGDDCEYCHSTGGFGGAAAAAAVAHRPMLHVAAGPAMRPGGLGLPGAIGGGAASMPFTHVGVAPGNCGVSCHTPGGSATPKPANHLPTLLSCDTCHRTSSWLPALFAHNNVASGSCGTCHAGNWATAKPAKHLLTNRTCDSCHHSTTTWMPVTYSHLDMIYSPHPANVACSACHVTNTEQVVWKYPNLKPGCGGCHGSQFATQSVRRAHGPGPVRPGAH